MRDVFTCLPVPDGYMTEIYASSDVISTDAGIVNVFSASVVCNKVGVFGHGMCLPTGQRADVKPGAPK
jgi:hypothetical protein